MATRAATAARRGPHAGAVGVLALAAGALVLAACGVDPGVVATGAAPAGAPTQTTEPAGTVPPDTGPPDTGPPGTIPPETVPPATVPPDTVPSETLPPVTVDTQPPVNVDRTPGPDLDLADVVDVGDDRTPREYDGFVAAALADLDAWWRRELPANYGIEFSSLAGGVIAATPQRSGALPGCGTDETTYQEINEYAAFYCPFGDFMMFDDGDDSLLAALSEEFGVTVMGVVLAHEFGHAIQQRIGALDAEYATILTEQQADCFSGAWVAHATSGDSQLVRLVDEDIRAALIAMVTVRDPVGVDQFSEGGHGSAFDRVGAFQEGFAGGVGRCTSLLDEPLPLMPNTFQNTDDVANEGDLGFGFDGDAIAPLIVETLRTYWTYQLGEVGLTFRDLGLVPVDELDAVICTNATRPLGLGVEVCDDDDTAYIDRRFARQLYDDPIEGRADFAVGYLIGTGWAERVQSQLGSTLTGEARALANDCLVGAWALDLFPRAPRPGEDEDRPGISPGDLDEAVLAAITLGDPTFADDRIGSAFEKIDAFREGVLGGFDTCLERIGS